MLQMMLLQWKSSKFSVLYLAWGLNPYAWCQTSCALWCLCVSSIGAYWLLIVSYKLLQKLCAPCHHALVLTFNSFFKTWSTSGRAYYNKTEFRYKFQDVVRNQKTWYQTIGIISCVQSGILVYYMIAYIFRNFMEQMFWAHNVLSALAPIARFSRQWLKHLQLIYLSVIMHSNLLELLNCLFWSRLIRMFLIECPKYLYRDENQLRFVLNIYWSIAIFIFGRASYSVNMKTRKNYVVCFVIDFRDDFLGDLEIAKGP